MTCSSTNMIQVSKIIYLKCDFLLVTNLTLVLINTLSRNSNTECKCSELCSCCASNITIIKNYTMKAVNSVTVLISIKY